MARHMLKREGRLYALKSIKVVRICSSVYFNYVCTLMECLCNSQGLEGNRRDCNTMEKQCGRE
jgi:hypothetical protein